MRNSHFPCHLFNTTDGAGRDRAEPIGQNEPRKTCPYFKESVEGDQSRTIVKEKKQCHPLYKQCYRFSNGVLDFLLSRSLLKRAVRYRFLTLCCTAFGSRLTTVIYPSGSMTEQLPTTQPTAPIFFVWPTAKRRRWEKRGGRIW